MAARSSGGAGTPTPAAPADAWGSVQVRPTPLHPHTLHPTPETSGPRTGSWLRVYAAMGVGVWLVPHGGGCGWRRGAAGGGASGA